MKNKICIITFLLIFFTLSSFTAPKSVLWKKWLTYNPDSIKSIDHSSFDSFLKEYVITNHPSGINRVKYSSVIKEDKKKLDNYIKYLSTIEISNYNRDEQKAFWINLYNALPIQLILKNYPIKSIKEISSGLFNPGPWNIKLINIENIGLSLNDIEHRILRPIWKDNRIHYAVNCASIGCPNISSIAFTKKNMDELLNYSAKSYINNTRGVNINGDKLIISTIYKWYKEDFNETDDGVIKHVLKYADKEKKEFLEKYKGPIKYNYNWDLNE